MPYSRQRQDLGPGDEDGKPALFSALVRALESYQQGRVPPENFSKLLEQLQLVLEVEVAQQQALNDSESGRRLRAGGRAVAGRGHVKTWLFRCHSDDWDRHLRHIRCRHHGPG